MNFYTEFCSGNLFPLHERLKGHDSVAIRQRLEVSQWWTPEQIAAYQAKRLRAFLCDIGKNVPYYREMFNERRFDPKEILGIRDLQRLPFLDKREIRAHTAALHADNHGPMTRFNTGGSSGEPLVFFLGKSRISHDVGAKWRATRWWNVDIGDSELVVWGSPIELGAQDRFRRLRDGLLRSRLLPAFEMSEAKLDDFVEEIRRSRPRMLFGYPSALALIGRHAGRRGVALDQLGIRVAFVTSERLYDEQREVISRSFGCPVANGYGGRDGGFIAHECPQGGMHVMAEDIVVELTDAAGQPVPPGQPGEVVITHLATRDFPFVRYRTGDVAIFDGRACACGRGLPLLSEIQGRATDFVVAADGTVIHGLALIYAVRDLPGIQAFKITQETRSLTCVQLVRDVAFDASCVGGIIDTFHKRLGAEVEVRIEFVDNIPPERSGKYRYVISHAT